MRARGVGRYKRCLQVPGARAASGTFDAFDRLVSDASATYAYDALDRLATRGAAALSFAGLERDMVADGTSTFAHDPGGAPVALSKGTTSLALNTDAHSDVVGTFTPGGATLTDTKNFDPWGAVTASSGTTNSALGYQSDWTDPTTNKVSMDARFYNPATSSFASRDSLADPAMANRYGYTPANPLGYTDPTGHFLIALPAIGIGAAVLAAATVGGGYLAYRAATGNPVTVKPGVITGAGTAGALALVQGGTAALNSYRGIFETLGTAAGATALAPTSLDYHVRGFNDAITATAAGTLPISGCAPCRDPRRQNAGGGGSNSTSITNSGPSVAQIAALAAAVAATPTARALTNDEKQLQIAVEAISAELALRLVDLSGHNQDQPKPAPPPLGAPQPKRDTECSKNPDDLLAQAATPPHPGYQDPAVARERANYRREHVAPQTARCDLVPVWFGQRRISSDFGGGGEHRRFALGCDQGVHGCSSSGRVHRRVQPNARFLFARGCGDSAGLHDVVGTVERPQQVERRSVATSDVVAVACGAVDQEHHRPDAGSSVSSRQHGLGSSLSAAMLIPPRRLSRWTAVPGTRTTYAGVVPLFVNRGVLEAGMASVVMAYPTSERSERQGVRLDFRWVVQLLYTSFWAADPAEPAGVGAADTTFALNVLDDSPMVREFTAGYSDPESWEPVFGDHRPEEVIRHFHIAFDDFGSYDVLAVDCVARSFTLSASEQRPWDPKASPVERAAEQAQKEALLLSDAMALAPLTPILSYPLG